MPTAAIWGAGGIANTHMDALRSNGIAVAAVVSRTEDGARAFAQRWGIPRWGTDPAMLFTPEIDCVHICTPPNLHYEMAVTLLEQGKHVLCEKPLCFSDEQARRLARLAARTGRVCAVNFNVRFHTACQAARKAVQAPDFGRVLLIHGSYLQEFGALPAPVDWRMNPQLAGRMHAVTEIGSHWMDLAQWISTRRITAVSAQFDHFHPTRYVENGVMHAQPGPNRTPMAVDSEDAAVISLRFEDGAMGAVVLSELSQGRCNHLSLEITGEQENLWWNSEQPTLLCRARRGEGVRSQVFAFGSGFADTFRSLIGAVYQDVAAGAPSAQPGYPTFADGMRNVQLCNAVLDSAQHNGAWISVPLQEEIT